MKKLLSLFATITLVGVRTSNLISCNSPAHIIKKAYHNIYILGDSLADTGALIGVVNQFASSLYVLPWIAHTQFSDPSYKHHNFSNGEVAVEILAHKLGFNLTPAWKYTAFYDFKTYEQKGNNYAIGGAEFAYDSCFLGRLLYNRFSYEKQTDALISQHKIQNDDLVVLEGGNNDLLRIIRSENSQDADKEEELTLKNEEKAINKLIANNVNHLLVINVPNLSNVPEFVNSSKTVKTRISNIVGSYDQKLTTYISSLSKTNQAKIREYDTSSAFDKYLALAKSQGINITDANVYIDYESVIKPWNKEIVINYYPNKNKSSFDKSFFYDEVHPSHWTHTLIANDLYKMVSHWNDINI